MTVYSSCQHWLLIEVARHTPRVDVVGGTIEDVTSSSLVSTGFKLTEEAASSLLVSIAYPRLPL